MEDQLKKLFPSRRKVEYRSVINQVSRVMMNERTFREILV